MNREMLRTGDWGFGYGPAGWGQIWSSHVTLISDRMYTNQVFFLTKEIAKETLFPGECATFKISPEWATNVFFAFHSYLKLFII